MAALVFASLANLWVILSTKNQIVSAEKLKEGAIAETALILGTSYNTIEGNDNPFFTSRISTSVELYKDNLVKDFILSGSATEYYNEPKAMARSLLSAGVPGDILTYDTLGVRTLSSIIRCKEVYHSDKVIIITQKFHAYRALFISNYHNLDAVAVTTEDVDAKGKPGLLLREFFARPLAVIDLYLLNSRP